MKLVVGLGNHGPEFNGTRHNIGFDALDVMVKPYVFNTEDHKHGYHFNRRKLTNKMDDSSGYFLVKPITGMNICGSVIKHFMDTYEIPVEDVIVIYDDMDFEPGQIKIKKGGGDGKHNGIKSLINHIGADFVRVRVGIGKPKTKEEGIDFVLGQFTNRERKLIDAAIEKAVGVALTTIKEGVDSAMVFFNRKE